MRKFACLIVDVCLVLITVGCTVYAFGHGSSGTFFRYYTTLSNMLAAIACALSIPHDVKVVLAGRGTGGTNGTSGANGEGGTYGTTGAYGTSGAGSTGGTTGMYGAGEVPLAMPAWLRTVRLAGVSGVMVTFLTVFLFLGFIAGHLNLIKGYHFFFHLVSPLLMLVGCLLREKASRLPMRAIALPIALSVLYAAVYFVEVVVIGQAAGGWDDIYRFNTGGLWPVSMAAMTIVFVVVSLGCWRLTRDRGR